MSSVDMMESTYAGTATDFLRSVNLKYDIDAPERIAHFRPTSKSIPLMNSLAFGPEPESALVVAPYGSGKSLLATFVAQVVENRVEHAHILDLIASRTKEVAPELYESLTVRLDPAQLIRPSGIALVLHGYESDLAASIRIALIESINRLGLDVPSLSDELRKDLDIEATLRLLSESKSRLKSAGARTNIDLQRVVILWDEFGRHLEDLIANGDAARLNEVQLLAEFVSRQKILPFSMAAFLHQSLANYASGLSQTVRKEWKKIEGRFETVQYVDDSTELTSLVADIVAGMPSQKAQPDLALIRKLLPSLRSVGLFRDLDNEALIRTLEKAYPLEPATLYLLPRVSARVAQNERTLFSFLFSVDLRLPVGPSQLFEYFEDAMRSDTGVGGTYHQWLETQNAIEKTGGDQLVDVIKTAGLLGLGISGQRSRVAKNLLGVAVAGYRQSFENAETLVEQLISQKLLLYRRTTDQVAIWHGVDIDLRGRLDQEKARIGLSFDVIGFLTSELPPRPLVPLEYNAEYRMTRYLSSSYVPTSGIAVALSDASSKISDGADGVVLHIIPEDSDDLLSTLEAIRATEISDRVVISVPRKTVQIYDSALEVYTLRRMQDDDALTNEDPLVLPELKQMTDDALEYLRRAMMRLCEPGPDGPAWRIQGQVQEYRSERDLRAALSELMRKVFSATPVINNELVVRKRPRQVIVNSRKTLVGAILDHYGEHDLALEGNRPDRSMFNTVLLHTGLYRSTEDTWHFAQPGEIKDKRLRKVWNEFRKLVAAPSKTPKDLSGFFKRLQHAPIGLRPGLFPILFAAALRAFPGVISITRGGEYVPDITQSVVESICSEPDEYEFKVLKMDEAAIEYLERLRACFRSAALPTSETDQLRMTYDVVQRWFSALPPAALSSRRVSPQATTLRGLLTRVADPVELFMRRLPSALGGDHELANARLDALERTITELENVTSIYYEFVESTLRDALQLRNGSEITSQVREWTALIPADAVAGISNSLAKSLYTRLSMSYDTPRRLADSVASLLVDRTINRWDDSTLSAFDRALRSTVNQLEEHALQIARTHSSMAQDLSRLAERRIRELFNHLKGIIGQEQARQTLTEIAMEESER